MTKLLNAYETMPKEFIYCEGVKNGVASHEEVKMIEPELRIEQ